MTLDLQSLTELSTLEHLVSTEGVEALLAALDTALAETSAEARVRKEAGPMVSARTLRVLRKAIALDADFLREHPEALFQSLYNRLRWYDAPDAAAHYVTEAPGPWEDPEAHLHALAALWRRQREAAGGPAWVESLLPLRGALEGVDLYCWHDHPVLAAAFSPCGTKLATGAWSDEENVLVWDVATGRRIQTFAGHHEAEVRGLAWSPDGKKLASGSRAHDARVWDVETGALLQDFTRQEGQVTSVTFSPDGRMLAVGNLGWRVHLFDVESGEKVRTLKGHQQSVLSVAFHPSGRFLASGSSDETVRVWDVATGEQLAKVPANAFAESVAFSPDGERMAFSSDEGVAIVETRDWTRLEGTRGTGRCTHIAWLGTTHLGMHSFARMVVLDAHGGDTVWSRPYLPDTHERALAFSPDRKHFALTAADGGVLVSELHAPPPPTLRTEPHRVQDLLGHPEGGGVIATRSETNVAVDADGHVREFPASSMRGGQQAWSTTRDGTLAAFPIVHFFEEPRRRAIQVFDLVNLSPAKELTAKPLEGRDTANRMTMENPLAFSPDGALLAGTVELGVVRVWRVSDGRLLHTLKGPAQPVSTVDFTPDGAYVVSGFAEDSRLMVHEVKTGALVVDTEAALDPTPTYATAAGVAHLAVGRDSGDLEVFDLATGSRRAIQVSRHPVVAVALSSDGSRVAACVLDKRVRVFDARTGSPLYELPHSALPYAIAIEDPLLVTLAEDHHTRFFDLATGAPRSVLEDSTEPQDVKRRYWETLGEGPVSFHRRMDPKPIAHFQDSLESCLILRNGIVVGRGRSLKDFLYVLRIHDASH
ncbi:WD40 repeat domain-containing protein [Myxococcaceae bacterium GXIMD 01537]